MLLCASKKHNTPPLKSVVLKCECRCTVPNDHGTLLLDFHMGLFSHFIQLDFSYHCENRTVTPISFFCQTHC